MKTTEAGLACLINWGVVDERTRDGDGGGLDTENEVGQLGGAREGVATLVVVELGAGDAGVVILNDGIVNQEQTGTGISNTSDGRTRRPARADSVTRGGEGPETLALVDGGVDNLALELGGIDVAEVVSAI